MVDGIFFIVSILIFRFIFPLFVYLTSLSPSPPLFSLYPYLSFSIGLLSTFPIYVILTSFFLSLTLVLSHYILYVLVQHNVLLSILFTTTYHSSKEICSLKKSSKSFKHQNIDYSKFLFTYCLLIYNNALLSLSKYVPHTFLSFKTILKSYHR